MRCVPYTVCCGEGTVWCGCAVRGGGSVPGSSVEGGGVSWSEASSSFLHAVREEHGAEAAREGGMLTG